PPPPAPLQLPSPSFPRPPPPYQAICPQPVVTDPWEFVQYGNHTPRSSGSFSIFPLVVQQKPTGRRNCSSPRRAFWRIASSDRCRNKFSSNSLIVPFKPRSNRSLTRFGS